MAKAKKKNYFNNDEITTAILQYKESLSQDKDEIYLLHPYTDQIQKLVRGVINTHKIYRWWDDVEELVQEGMLAIYASFKRFDPEKGTAFNYLSIVVKQHLKNWTQQRNKKSWKTFELQDDIYNEEEGEESKSEGFVVMENVFSTVDVPERLDKTLEQIVRSIVIHGLDNRRDVVKYLTSQGYEKSDIDEVFTQLSKQINNGNRNVRGRKESIT